MILAIDVGNTNITYGLYKNKKLKVQEFETISKQLNGIGMGLNPTKGQRKMIEEYQTYRNKLFHLTCNVETFELESIRDNLLMYSINTVMYLLFAKYQNERSTDFMAQLTIWDYFNTLQYSTAYRETMKKIATLQRKTSPLSNCYSTGRIGQIASWLL